jgi:hypothetical protein
MSNQLGVPSSAVFVSKSESLKDVLIIDKDYFSSPDRHKFMDLVNKYQRRFEEFTINKSISKHVVHQKCVLCLKLVCPLCLVVIDYDKNDFLEPYCHLCEMFFTQDRSPSCAYELN